MSYSSLLGRGNDLLKRVAAGWTDTTLVTIRKMAADGATANAIAATVGMEASAVVKLIRREKLVWNKGGEGWHKSLSAASRSNQGLPVDVSWRPRARAMFRDGASFRDIAAAVGRSAPTVRAWILKDQEDAL